MARELSFVYWRMEFTISRHEDPASTSKKNSAEIHEPSQQGGQSLAVDENRKSGPILNVKTPPIEPGSSGLQIHVNPDLLLEGYRPKRIVRVDPSSWPVAALPTEDEYFGQ